MITCLQPTCKTFSVILHSEIGICAKSTAYFPITYTLNKLHKKTIMIKDIFSDYVLSFWHLLCEMAPYLLLGFFIAGLLQAFVPRSMLSRHLASNNWKSVVKAALFGIPLPLCSCGVIPTTAALRREGASKGAATSFLIATPQTGVDSIMATYSVLGPALPSYVRWLRLSHRSLAACLSTSLTVGRNGREMQRPRQRNVAAKAAPATAMRTRARSQHA